MESTSFAERTRQFWAWFTENEERISGIAQDRGASSEEREQAVEFISEGVALLSEDLYFNIGGEHEFTFSVNANDAMFFLLPYVTANLPEQFREKWSFSPCMQGTGGENFKFGMHGVNVDTDSVMVAVSPDEAGRTADILFYAEEWDALDENDCYSAFYILMELTIGEALANMCIGEVQKADAPVKGMFPLTNLEQWMLGNLCEDGEVPDPAMQHFTYRREPEEDEDGQSLRQDIFVGIANYIPILSGYDSGEDECYQSFVSFGAKPVFLYYYYDGGSEADRQGALDWRNDTMDMLEEQALGQRGSGQETGLLLGGAMGEYRAYIDLLLYDEPEFLEKARALLKDSPNMIFVKEFCPDGREFLLTDEDVPGFADRLGQLVNCGAFAEIVKILEAMPPEKLDYEMNSILSRALNNIDEYQRALDIMETIRCRGESDPAWHYRRGYSLWYLDREAEAEAALLRAKELAKEGDPVLGYADELLEMIEEWKNE